MKKTLSIALATVLMLTMTSCGLMEEFVRETLGDEAADEYRAQNEIALEKNQPLVGKTVRVLCDGLSKTNETLCQGRTDQAKIVFFPCDASRMGEYVDVRIERADSYALYGTPV